MNITDQKSLIAAISKMSDEEKMNLIKLEVDTQVSDVKPLAELKNLTTLYLGYTQVSDVTPLAELKNLTMLYLSHTQVSDVKPLAELNVKIYR